MYDSASVFHMLNDVCSKSALSGFRGVVMILLTALAIAFWIMFGAFISVLCMIILKLWRDGK